MYDDVRTIRFLAGRNEHRVPLLAHERYDVAALAACVEFYADDADVAVLPAGFVDEQAADELCARFPEVTFVVDATPGLYPAEPEERLFTPKAHVWRLKLLFKRLVRLLEDSSLTYWLDSGSLLGAHRHGGIAPWDDDADLGIHAADAPALEALRPRLEAEGMRLKRNRTGAYFQVDFAEDTDPARPEVTNAVHVDVFFFADDGTGTLVNTDPRFASPDQSAPDKCNIRYTPGTLLPLRRAPFYTLSVNVPRRTHELLSAALGEDFMRDGVVGDLRLDARKFLHA